MKAEDRFVERLRSLLPKDGTVAVGPGDDAAVIRASEGDLVATTDLMIEGVDFLAGAEPEMLGRRVLAINLSDLAAMGARPQFFLLSIGFAPENGEEYPLAVARGALSRAGPLGVRLVGGDLSGAAATILSVALWGRPEGRPLLRSGGRRGDLLFLSGCTGRAAAGRLLAQARAGGGRPGAAARLAPELEAELLRAYHDPEPRTELGLALGREGLATAAIDVSDGLGVDAARLARASGLRAVLEEERLPVSPALTAHALLGGTDPLDAVLAGGDDYELLFAAPESSLASVEKLARAGVPVTRIGRLEEGEGAFLRGRGSDREIGGLGYDHLERRP